MYVYYYNILINVELLNISYYLCFIVGFIVYYNKLNYSFILFINIIHCLLLFK